MTKTLLGSLREYKKGSILTILLSVLEAAFEILIPLRMADLIDQGIEPGEMAAVWKFGAFLLLFAPWADTAIASSALVLYRVATYFFPFLLSVIVFLREEKKSLKDFDAQSA